MKSYFFLSGISIFIFLFFSNFSFTECRYEIQHFYDKPEEEFENNKYGFYEIQYVPPTNINYPILPTRLENGGIQWNLLPGRGIYNNVDIEDDINNGYKINFIDKCLVYDNTIDDLFSGYINYWYNIKSMEDLKPENERNDSRRNIAKLIMNGLYGKILQKAQFKKTMIADRISQIFELMDNYNITGWEILTDNKILLIGEINEKKENDVITKSVQYGSYILG